MMRCLILIVVQALFLMVQFLGTTCSRSTGSSRGEQIQSPLAAKTARSRMAGPVSIPETKSAQDLVDSWCSAYGSRDAKQLAALATPEVSIVDRFGTWHRLAGANDKERFWQEGFDIVQSEGPRWKCSFQQVRFVRPDVAIVQARVFYTEGIDLKGGEHIPPYSELHMFVATKLNDVWLISAHSIIKEVSSDDAEKGTLSFKPTSHIAEVLQGEGFRTGK